MQPQREIPVEEEPDDPPIDEYEPNELKNLLDKKQKIYLSKTSSQGRQPQGGSAVKMRYMIQI
tara:strand:- start:282 stop:470 length:189 start_codon:yes stop_codon:yes gene_type:complete